MGHTFPMPMPHDASELDDWVKVVDRLPFVGSFKRDLTTLRKYLYDRRAPRIAAIGLPGAGRTSLANALLAAQALGEDGVAPDPEPGQWVTIDAEGRRLRWLELPADLESAHFDERADAAFEEAVPDVLLLVATYGQEAEAGPVLADVAHRLRERLDKQHGRRPLLLGVVTASDRAEPPEAVLPPYATDKRQAIDHAVDRLKKDLKSLRLPEDGVVAAAAPPEEGARGRWRVDRLAERILTDLPAEAQLEAVRAFDVGRSPRRMVGRQLVNAASAVAITVGLAPVPFADVVVLLPLQAAMVTGIAYLSGRPWDQQAATEYLTSLGLVGGAGFGLRWGARQLVKVIPGAGSIVSASFAGAGTLAIGRGAMAYFIDGPGALGERKELRADNPA